MRETITNFWSEMRKGFVEGRAAAAGDEGPVHEERASRKPQGPEWAPVEDEPACDECNRREAEIGALKQQFAECQSVIRELTAEVDTLEARLKARTERKGADVEALQRKVAECTKVIADLVAENGKLAAKLSEKGPSEQKPSRGAEQYKKLKIAIAKHLHPDTVAADKALAAAVERIFKELRADIDRIDQL
jgi:hypothetical protein